jgi:protoporphyrinogen oxidase
MGASVAILGAGLTGMSSAHALRAQGVPFRLFEKTDRVGGHAVTIEEEGYRFDRTGHLLHVDDPRALAWMGPHRSVERRSAVWSHGVYTRYPFQANAHGLPPEVAYACVMGFLAARAEGPIESFEDFCRARFGDAITERFMLPYNEKLWGVEASEITAAWCEGFVPVPTVADVIAGAVGHPLRELGYNARFVYPERGIGQLSEGMARDLPVELSRAPERIDLARRLLVFAEEEVPFSTLISTAPLPSLVSLLEAPPEVRAAAEALRCTHLCYLDVALDEPCGQPYHWIYVPERRYPFYRVGCYSHFSPAMAPAGKAGLYVELADRAAHLETALPAVIEGLVEMGVVSSARAIRFARLRRIDHAYVIFDRRYFASVATVQAFLAEHDIVSTGRYGGWNYSSMGDALRFGREAAERAQTMMTRTRA